MHSCVSADVLSGKKLPWYVRPGLYIAHPWREAVLPVAPVYYICRAPFLNLCLFAFMAGLVYLNGDVFSCASLIVSLRVKTLTTRAKSQA